MASRVSKEITSVEDINMLLAIKEEDIGLSLIMELFGEFDGKVKFHQYDTFVVPAGAYGRDKKTNKKPFRTTVGIWVFNKYMIEKDLLDLIGYVNEELNKKKWNGLVSKVTQAVIEDDVPVEALDNLLQKSQKLMPICTVLSPSISEKFLTISKVIQPKKDELFKKYEKEINAGDAVTMEKIEKELIQYALDYLGDDPSLDLYYSGARSSIPNHFKNMYICKGMVRDPDPNAEQQYHAIKSCFNDGISKEDYGLLAKSLVRGPYSRAGKTAVGGYWEKLIVSGYQHVVLDPEGSDCGTNDYIEEILTDKNVDDWMYSFIIDGGSLVELNSKNKSKYIGKRVKIRYSAFCESKTGICNKCMGNMPYKLGVKNAGIAVYTLASAIKNINMKAFHDSSITTTKIDVKKAFGE